jgi:hypothetical protein
MGTSTIAATRWPNLFLVGAPKAGTTSLHSHLVRHPEVFMSDPKEPHFFCSVSTLPAWRGQAGATTDADGRPVYAVDKNPEHYLALFAGAGAHTIRGDASTSYLSDAGAPDAIAEVAPGASIIAVIRDPVARAYSDYHMHVREGWEHRSFADAVAAELAGDEVQWADRYLGNGMYSSDIARYLNRFGDRVMVLVFDELFADVPGTLDRVYDFLGLDHADADAASERALNSHTRPRNRMLAAVMQSETAWKFGRQVLPPRLRHRVRDAVLVPAQKERMPADVERKLRRHFAADVQATEGVLDRRLPWERFEL